MPPPLLAYSTWTPQQPPPWPQIVPNAPPPMSDSTPARTASPPPRHLLAHHDSSTTRCSPPSLPRSRLGGEGCHPLPRIDLPAVLLRWDGAARHRMQSPFTFSPRLRGPTWAGTSRCRTADKSRTGFLTSGGLCSPSREPLASTTGCSGTTRSSTRQSGFWITLGFG